MDNSNIIPVAPEERVLAQAQAQEQLANTKPILIKKKHVIDDEVVRLLIAAKQMGLNVKSSCLYAGIGRTQYYARVKEDEDFANTMEIAELQFTLKAGNVIDRVLTHGSDRDAGPMAKWVFERKQSDEYGQKIVQDNSKKTQNNYYSFSRDELSNIAKQPDIHEADPTELLEALEEASILESRAEEEGTP